MSAAGRTPGIRRESDAYPTPLWVTRRLLEAIKPLITRAATDPGPGAGRTARQPRFFDPCAGRGHIVRAIREQWPGAHITGWDIELAGFDELVRAGCDRWDLGLDSLEPSRGWPQADVIVMNPPFTLADEFIEKALKAAPAVCVLERVDYFGRKWRGREPSMLKIPERIPFVHKCFFGTGKKDFVLVPYDLPSPEGTIRREIASDSTGYCWGVWEPSRAARYIVLPDTPLEERKEGSWINQ